MTPHQALQLFLPIVILLPVLYIRLRKMSRAQPLKVNRLWIRPAVILLVTGLVLFAPHPHAGPRVLLPQDWLVLAAVAGLGGVAGWYMGRTMKIDVHPEDGTLMVKGSQAAMLVLVVLILLRLGLRTGLAVEGKAWHLDVLLLSDASIIFTAALFTVRSVEMYIRAHRVLAAAQPAVS